MTKIIGFIGLILSLMISQAFANNCYLLPSQPWRLIFSVGTGLATTSAMGMSGYFPITNPAVDEYYLYNEASSTDSSGLIDLGFAGEFEIQTGLLLQLGLNYMQPNSFTGKGQFVQGADTPSQNTYNYQYKVLAKQVLFEAKVLVQGNADQKYHPYILVGGGVSQNNTYDYKTNVPATLTFTRDYEDKIYNAPSYMVGGGIEFDIHEQARLGVGYRYTGLGKTTFGTASIDGTPVTGTLYQSNLNLNIYIAQITLRF